jgi:hypothetical protein
MPFKIVKDGDKYFVVNEKTGKRKNKVGYRKRSDAVAYQRALYANTKDVS